MQIRVRDNEAACGEKTDGLIHTNRAHNLRYYLFEVSLVKTMLVVVWVKKDTKGTKFSD